jgi:NO-binding membrane sensor protein with MHYT domain
VLTNDEWINCGPALTSGWDMRLVVLSVAVAIGGSFAGLDCAERMRAAPTAARRRRYFVAGAALIGISVWTMHFVGMLAHKLPVPVRYEATLSIGSMFAAAFGAGLAFLIVSRPVVRLFHLLVGGLAMGTAIASMHYLGMASMRMAASIRYDPLLFCTSIGLAVTASAGALALASRPVREAGFITWIKSASAVVMGAAIAGMHYVGMAAARYLPLGQPEVSGRDAIVGTWPLADLLVAGGLVLGIAVISLASKGAAERQTALDSYRDLTVKLEQLVDQRTAELKAANSELAAFSYTVSHDLKAPLRAISASAQLMLRTSPALNPDGRRHLERIVESVRHMSELIEGLLKLSNLSRTELRRHDVDLTVTARAIFRELAAGDPHHQVQLQVEEDLVTKADPSMVASLLQNLLANAWKFTRDQPQPRVSVSARQTATERIFEIRDNGVGFNMQYANRLFGVFQRLHDASAYPGTGIGLATCKRIVERHGGRIWAESEEGKGAAFFFTLAPASEAAGPASTAVRQSADEHDLRDPSNTS